VTEPAAPKNLGKYEVQSLLGRGAMGVVYKGYDPVIDRVVAIKVMHEHLFQGREGADFARRFQQEARAAARCWHPNIVAIFDFGTERNVPYLVMELVEGRELYELLESRQFTIRESIELVVPVLSALHHAHAKGVVHRDIKPSNIIVLEDGGIKVADFGVAHLDTSDLTRSGYVVGTLGYMSPEGERGEVVDSRSDIYSAAMVLLQLMTGHRPHPGFLRGQSVAALMAETGLSGGEIPALVSILETALDAFPDRRYQSAEQLQNSLMEWLAGATISADSRATIAVRARPAAGGSVPSGSGPMSPALLKLMEERLASYVGPMASHFVRRASRGSTDVQSVVAELASHIADPDERRRFLSAIESSDIVSSMRRSAQSGTGAPRSSPRNSATTLHAPVLALNAETLGRIATELTYFIGPLASRLVQSVAAQVSTLPELCEALASHIPSEQDRQKFLERVRRAVPKG
jgi:serine/threonine protein kinase